MLDVGMIKPSKSAWSNAVVIVWKKDGGLRFFIDFWRLKGAFPLPQIHNAIDALRGSNYYMTVDLLSRFWQTPMEESSKQYTAFNQVDVDVPMYIIKISKVECKPFTEMNSS